MLVGNEDPAPSLCENMSISFCLLFGWGKAYVRVWFHEMGKVFFYLYVENERGMDVCDCPEELQSCDDGWCRLW